MTLQDYTTEELRAELKRRTDLVKAEKANGKYYRCHTASQLACEHFEQSNND